MNRRFILGSCLIAFVVNQIIFADPLQPGPLSPAESMKKMEIVPGYTIELVASEPDVVDPVAFTWDADGRLYVAEMGDYPANPGGGRIKLLIDRDGDGQTDSQTLFAEGIPFPNGLLAHRNGILVTASPDILFLADTDGDGKADQREIILTGFHAANQQLRVNGLAWSYDGWVYAANGRNGGNITSPKRPAAPAVNIDRHDLRFRPDTGEIEPVAGFSQFGNAFDAQGERFINWNTIPIRHVVFPHDVALRHPTFPPANDCEILTEPQQENRIFPISDRPATFNKEPAGYFNASCGLSIEKGGIFPPNDAGSAFVCEPLFNIVHRRLLVPSGATFIGQRPPAEQEREFLASRDPWFRPVFTQSGPDGGLYIADFYRQWVEHPDFVRPELRGSVAWDIGKDRGRIYRVRPTQATRRPVPKLSVQPSEKLVAHLSDANAPVHDAARRLLWERNDRSVIPALREILNSRQASGLARLNALSLLALWDEPTESLLTALDVPEPSVDQWTIRFVRQRPDANRWLPKILETPSIAQHLKAGSQPIIFELILGAERLPTDQRVHYLRKLHFTDPWCESALACIIDDAAIPLLQAQYLAANPIALPGQIPTTLARIAGRQETNPESSPFQEMVGHSAAQPSNELHLVSGWLQGLADQGKPIPATIGKVTLSQWTMRAKESLTSPNSNHVAKENAIALLSFDSSPQTGSFLIELLSQPDSLEVKQACLRALRPRPGNEVAIGLVKAWPAASLSIKRELLELLLARTDRVAVLLQAIADGTILPSEIDSDSKRRLLELSPADRKEDTAKLLGSPASADRSTVIASVQSNLPAKGEMAKGKEIFAKHCSGCHRSGDLGHRVGPDLAGMATKSREQLLEDILDPNKQILPDYVAVSIVTTDGITLNGLLAAESSTSVTLRRAEGVMEQVARSQMEEFRGTGKSLMPEGFEQSISPTAFADLIAFLRQRP
jgi:putative membrane-bound dehydrogenase-like protein